MGVAMSSLLQEQWRPPAPRCKRCGAKPCQHYGGVGGWSAQCEDCNRKCATRQREWRRKVKTSQTNHDRGI
jgi:hypothetical protein